MNARVVIFEEEQQQLQEICERLNTEALARAVFLIDKNGQILVTCGDTAEIDTTSLASLVAGTTAATSSLARLIGEEEFPAHYHQGVRDNLHVSSLDEEHILSVIFDHRSSLGLVRLRVKRASERLHEVLLRVAERQSEAGDNSVFDDLTEDDIDNLFNDSF